MATPNFLALRRNGYLYSSNDGVTWSQRTPPAVAIRSNGVVGYNPDDETFLIAFQQTGGFWRYDGAIFTTVSQPGAGVPRALECGGGVWLYAGSTQGNSVHRSADNGATWAPVDFGIQDCLAVGYDHGTWLVLLSDFTVRRSTDGAVTWSSSDALPVGTTNTDLSGVAYNPDADLWMVCNDRGDFARSADDGRTWVAVGSTAGDPHELVYTDGRFVAGSSSYYAIVSSNNGASWDFETINSSFSGAFERVAALDGAVVAAGTYLASSVGGAPWALRITGADAFVAVGAAYRINMAPNAPILITPADGATIDRNSTNRFDWDFSDPDPGDTQSWFRLRYRPVGAATWTVVDGSTPNTYWDAPAGTFAAGDYEWQVATRDAQGEPASDANLAFSPSSFFTAGDAPPGPTITSPSNGGTFLQTQTVEWSTPVQDAYQIQVRDTADTVLYATGQVTSETTRTATVPFPDNGTTRKLRLRVLDGGLWSPWYEITGTVSWLAPPDPVVSLLADDASGALAIAITNPAPTGEEPAAVYNDVEIDDGDGWVRVATMVAINGIYTYWLPRAGRDYGGNVRVTAVAENGVTASTTTTTTTEPPVEGFYGGY